TGQEEQANAAFKEQAAELEQVLADKEHNGEGQTTPTVAFFYLTSNGAVNVRKANDYVPKMIELAGGKYIFDKLGDTQSKNSSVTMQMEEFYASAKDVDCLIYNSTIDGQITSIDELVAKNQLLADFKAVQSGNVWCTTQNMYQESMAIGSMIADMHTAFVTDVSQNTDTRYLFKLNE
ncbi:MAG: ABC transporter substrate-binding protein, partial [Lachnospiraceae bacterium]